MSIAKLKISGDDVNERSCREFSFRVIQGVDYSTGRPATNVAPLELNVTCMAEKSAFLFGLAIDPSKKISGSLEIMDSDDHNKPQKTLKFEEAIVTSHTEFGDDKTSEPHERVTIVARISELEGHKLEVQWKRS